MRRDRPRPSAFAFGMLRDLCEKKNALGLIWDQRHGLKLFLMAYGVPSSYDRGSSGSAAVGWSSHDFDSLPLRHEDTFNARGAAQSSLVVRTWQTDFFLTNGTSFVMTQPFFLFNDATFFLFHGADFWGGDGWLQPLRITVQRLLICRLSTVGCRVWAVGYRL